VVFYEECVNACDKADKKHSNRNEGGFDLAQDPYVEENTPEL